jgi:hypothetical protein
MRGKERGRMCVDVFDKKEEEVVYSLPLPPLNNRLVIPEFKVAAKPGDADKDAAGLGCYTIGDEKNKVALLMCEGVNTDITPPAKGKYSVSASHAHGLCCMCV